MSRRFALRVTTSLLVFGVGTWQILRSFDAERILNFHGTHYLFLNYSHGFILRGLPGELFARAFPYLEGSDKVIAASYISMALAFCVLAWQCLSYVTHCAGSPDASALRLVIALLIVLSPFYVVLGYLVGYPDSIVYILCMAAFRVADKSSVWLLCISFVAILCHELAVFLVVPIILYVGVTNGVWPRRGQELAGIFVFSIALVWLDNKDAYRSLLSPVPRINIEPLVYFYTRGIWQSHLDMYQEWGKGACFGAVLTWLVILSAWCTIFVTVAGSLNLIRRVALCAISFVPLSAYLIALDFFRFAMCAMLLIVLFLEKAALSRVITGSVLLRAISLSGLLAIAGTSLVGTPLYTTGDCSGVVWLPAIFSFNNRAGG